MWLCLTELLYKDLFLKCCSTVFIPKSEQIQVKNRLQYEWYYELPLFTSCRVHTLILWCSYVCGRLM